MRLAPLFASLLLSGCAARAHSAPIATCPAVAPVPAVAITDDVPGAFDQDDDDDHDDNDHDDDDRDDDDHDIDLALDDEGAELERAIEAHVGRVLAKVERELSRIRVPTVRVPHVRVPRVRVEFDD